MPDDLTPTKSIAYEWGNEPTLDDLIKTFTAAADGQHLRWTQAKGFHTHRKYEFSGVDILARVGLTHWRDQRRADAVVKLRAFITEKYGKDIADRVLGEIPDNPLKASITIGDLSKSWPDVTAEPNRKLKTVSEQNFKENMLNRLKKYEAYSDVENFDELLGRCYGNLPGAGNTNFDETLLIFFALFQVEDVNKNVDQIVLNKKIKDLVKYLQSNEIRNASELVKIGLEMNNGIKSEEDYKNVRDKIIAAFEMSIF